MSFDVYVGSFTRYITGDWENAGQRAAREEGVEYKLIRGDETEEEPPPADEVRAEVAAWRDALNEGLKEHLATPLDWREDEGAPYFTERPGWHGYAALLLHAAHDDHPELPRPKTLPDEWGDDAAYQAVTADDAETRYPALVLADLWLPGDFDFMFGVKDLGDNDRSVASTMALLEELQELNERTFEVTPEDVAKWRQKEVPDDASFDTLARAGLAHMLALAEEAVRAGLPLMTDY